MDKQPVEIIREMKIQLRNLEGVFNNKQEAMIQGVENILVALEYELETEEEIKDSGTNQSSTLTAEPNI